MSVKTVSGIVAAIIIWGGFIPASAQGADALLDIIPADAIFCVRINNLNQTTANLDQYLMGLGPMPVSTAGIIKGQLGGMFGNPELKGFDVNGSFAAFATVEPNQTTPDFYILLPITDYNQVIDPNFRVSQPDANGISAAGMGLGGQFFISKVRSFALMSNDYRKLGAMAGLISDEKTAGIVKSLDAAQVKQASSEPIWAYVNMVKISAVYKKQISDGIEEMAKHAADPAASIQTQIDNLEKTKKQDLCR